MIGIFPLNVKMVGEWIKNNGREKLYSLPPVTIPFFIFDAACYQAFFGSSRKVVERKSEHLWQKPGVLVHIL